MNTTKKLDAHYVTKYLIPRNTNTGLSTQDMNEVTICNSPLATLLIILYSDQLVFTKTSKTFFFFRRLLN